MAATYKRPPRKTDPVFPVRRWIGLLRASGLVRCWLMLRHGHA